MPVIFSLLVIALMVFALIDIIRRDDAQVKHMPKMVWLILVILLPLVGSVLWFTLGREYDGAGVSIPRMPQRQDRAPRSAPPAQAYTAPTDNRTTEQQIADLDREIEEWELRQKIAQRRRETESGSGANASDVE